MSYIQAKKHHLFSKLSATDLNRIENTYKYPSEIYMEACNYYERSLVNWNKEKKKSMPADNSCVTQ